jgi:recombinational DNA repair ATPase RecF
MLVMTDHSNRYTLAEAARLTGLSTEALRLRIRRGKLAAEKANDGLRVVLTTADIDGIVAGQERQQKPTDQVDQTNAVKVLAEAVGLLREQVSRERAGLEEQIAGLRDDLEAARARGDQAEREREEARVHAATVAARLEATETVLAEVRAALEEARRWWWQRWFWK